ncbi:unnamed protein product [Arabidopsis lyrata]|uniref:Predicted protein n=1 Tax=Arabidopsis lyrata subsp. lyrata TaxID=81972 RepID=D7LW85_ARALL|nr:predicted protein [Arabidopsis lyrata subsp. lyrata]CAH8269092.1 unnamed protein product [Arabidopsis lyrata]
MSFRSLVKTSSINRVQFLVRVSLISHDLRSRHRNAFTEGDGFTTEKDTRKTVAKRGIVKLTTS